MTIRSNPIAMADIPLCQPSTTYRPFRYPWAHEFAVAQDAIRWLPDEVPLGDDVRDYVQLPAAERALLDAILRLFTQSDVDVTENYMLMYQPVFRNAEVGRMLLTFGQMETIHVRAYAHLLDTLGKEDSYFDSFLEIKEMRDKHDLMRGYRMDEPREVLTTLALAGGFGEGLQLFSQFAMLLNYPRFGKMKGMGQIVSWSIRDETLHVQGLMRLFHEFSKESGIPVSNIADDIYQGAKTVVMLEDAFIDHAFSAGPVRGLTPEDMKQYIRYTADHRLQQLGLKPLYKVGSNPLGWMSEMLGLIEHANFFETRATEYAKATMRGTWAEAWQALDMAQERKKKRQMAGTSPEVEDYLTTQEIRNPPRPLPIVAPDIDTDLATAARTLDESLSPFGKARVRA